MGIIFGNLMIYYYLLSAETLLEHARIGPWALIVSGCAGFLSSVVMSAFNSKKKNIVFIHFYTMAVGLIILMVGSSVLAARPGNKKQNLFKENISIEYDLFYFSIHIWNIL